MSFNLSECHVLHITKVKCPIQTRYTILGNVLESVPSAKYLGVTSDDLSWSPHIDTIFKKANNTLVFLKRTIKVHNKVHTLHNTSSTTAGVCFNSLVPSYSAIKKSRGPKTELWGTPLTTGALSDEISSTTTLCVQPVRNGDFHSRCHLMP